MSTMEKVAILARVSTQGQDYERQVLELTDYCQRMNWEVVKVFANKVSGVTRTASSRTLSGWWRSSIGADTSIFWCHKREQISVEAYPRGKCIYTAPYLPILSNLRNGRPSFYRGTRSVRPAGLGLLDVLDGVRLEKSIIFPLLFLPNLLFI